MEHTEQVEQQPLLRRMEQTMAEHCECLWFQTFNKIGNLIQKTNTPLSNL